MSEVFVDSGALFSIVAKNDLEHKRAAGYFTSAKEIFITTDYIFDEFITLVRMKISHDIAVEIGEKIREGLIKLVDISPQDREAAWGYFKKHQDKTYSFTDCTSFCIMKRLGIQQAFTFDKHFVQAGFTTVP